MVKILAVDPSGLSAAATKLGNMTFPVLPAPEAVTGTDPTAAAINSTLPSIESPVVDGLPAVQASLTQTGSAIASAAAMYAEIDQALGRTFGQLKSAASQLDAMAAGPLRTAAQLGLTTSLPMVAIGGVSPLAQSLAQGVQAASARGPGASPIPAQLTTDGSAGQPHAGETSADETNEDNKDTRQRPDTETDAGDARAAPDHRTLKTIPRTTPLV